MPPMVNYLSIGLFTLVALQALSAIISLASVQAAVERTVNQASQNPALSPDRAEAAVRAIVIGGAVFGLILAGIFLWLTIMVRKGRNWARITSTVFLSLGIIFGLIGLFGGGTTVTTLIAIVMLLLEIAVLVMLWLRPSNEYFRPAQHFA